MGTRHRLDTVKGEHGGALFTDMAITHEVRMTDDGGGVLRIMLNDERKLVLRIECGFPDNDGAEFHLDADGFEQVLQAIKYIGHG